MCKQGFRNLGLGLGALLVAALLIGNTTPASAQNPSGGPQEGIQVHGDWVIEVRNPDGSLDDRREFKNALELQGRAVLALLISRQFSTGFWAIGLEGEPSPCVGSLFGCGIYESGAGGTVFNLAAASGNLQVTGVPINQVQLAGSVTATAASSIHRVATFVATCPAAIAPATPCLLVSNQTRFFSRTLPGSFQPVPVIVGQIIQVTVTFSFS